MLNAELGRLDLPLIQPQHVCCSLKLARDIYGSKAPAKLDALCERMDIDTSHREVHGAIKDCQLTATVYQKLVEMTQHESTQEI